MSVYSKLRVKDRRFVDAYVETGSGVLAMKRIKFKGRQPRIAASKLLAKPGVREAVAERDKEAMENAGITRTRMLIELRRIATFDPAKLTDKKGLTIPLHKVDEDTRAAIAGIDVEEIFAVGGEGGEGSAVIGQVKKFKHWNKTEAIKLILQAAGALIENHRHAGPNGGPIPIKDASELSDTDRARRVAFLLAQGYRASLAQASVPDPADEAG